MHGGPTYIFWANLTPFLLPGQSTWARSRTASSPVWAFPGWLSALSVSHSKLFLYGAFAWVCRVLNSQNRRFPARAVLQVRFSSSITMAWVQRIASQVPAPTHAALPCSCCNTVSELWVVSVDQPCTFLSDFCKFCITLER